MTRTNHVLPGKPGRVTSPGHRRPAARFKADVISVTSEKAGLAARQAPASLHRLVRVTDRALLERNRSRPPRRPRREPAPRRRQVGPLRPPESPDAAVTVNVGTRVYCQSHPGAASAPSWSAGGLSNGCWPGHTRRYPVQLNSGAWPKGIDEV
jgi:hypothetical protein